MAENRQFGGDPVFGDRGHGGSGKYCAMCEAMLADALDGTLPPAEQAKFELHADECESCGQLVADARRGAAWLQMLRHPAPEPPAHLLDRILAQTSHVALVPVRAAGMAVGEAALEPGYAMGAPAHFADVIPFPRYAVAALRRTPFGQIALQPRLVMTAAMAFFSVALTLNITGFRPTSLRASDLTPSSLRRDVISANTQVVRYYESLRVVYELESRVHDLQSAQDTDVSAGDQSAPVEDNRPTDQPASGPDEHKGAPPPSRRRPAPGGGTSRRDDLVRPRRLVVSQLIGGAGMAIGRQARLERSRV